MTSRCSVHDFASLNLPAYGRQAIGTLEKGACLPGLPKKTLPHYPKKQLNLSGKSLFINAPTSLCGTGRERRRTGLLGRVFLLCNPQRPTCQMRGNLKIATPGLWLFISGDLGEYECILRISSARNSSRHNSSRQ